MAFTSVITGTATWPATLPGPANGDAGNGVNFQDLVQKVANGLVYLRSSPLSQQILAASAHYVSGFSKVAALETSEAYSQDSVVGPETVVIEIPTPPAGVTLDSISVKLKGAGGHAWPIGFLPYFQLYTKSVAAMDGNWSAAAAAVTDPSGSAAAYQTVHEILQTEDEVMSQGSVYSVRLIGESGANSLVGLVIYSLTVLYKF